MNSPASSDSKSIAAFWCRIPSPPNFGDALTPWLIRRITGRYPQFRRPEDRREKYFVCGSIAAYACAFCTVWGAGIMDSEDALCPEARFLAVRGPLTRARALAAGAACPAIYGVPALLLPRLYRPVPMNGGGMGLVLHMADKHRISAQIRRTAGVKLIDIQDPIETVIDEIASCDFVASSSLHGLITAHAYGVPAIWVRFRPLPSGDDSKFRDYFLSIGQDPPEPVLLSYGDADAAALSRHARTVRLQVDVEALWNTCPFRRTQSTPNY